MHDLNEDLTPRLRKKLVFPIGYTFSRFFFDPLEAVIFRATYYGWKSKVLVLIVAGFASNDPPHHHGFCVFRRVGAKKNNLLLFIYGLTRVLLIYVQNALELCPFILIFPE